MKSTDKKSRRSRPRTAAKTRTSAKSGEAAETRATAKNRASDHPAPAATPVAEPPQSPPQFGVLTDTDIHLFNEGRHFRLFEKLGARPMQIDGQAGTYFAVWAPDAKSVSVFGDFNYWNGEANPLAPRASSGIWEGFVPGVGHGAIYKYRIIPRHTAVAGEVLEKADPFAFFAEVPPKTGSIVWDTQYEWGDADWMRDRGQANDLHAPMAIYEMHVGSWMHSPEENGRPLTYRELAPRLVEYLEKTGFTHVEFLPLMEHPFAGSWGYQTTGYFAPTSRFGTPQDLMYLIDTLHRHGIGVILDWVPSHFPTDAHGPGLFDGTHLYEHEDPRKGFHPDWTSYIFNYGRHEVSSFLTSSAVYWLEHFHADGLRVDAVASLLYLDYSRAEGEWIPNEHGGRENLEAIRFIRTLNEQAYGQGGAIQTIAEESTSWPMVSRPVDIGGLGFGLKWDMGWMHDTLQYLHHDPIHRRYHHNNLTFRMLYAFNENFVLPLSHDEVVHGKGSLLDKMAGDTWQKFANLRLLFGNMYSQPGKKLIFMGCEFGQWREWNHDASLDWHLLQYAPHQGIQRWVGDLNRLYRAEPAMHEGDIEPWGFEWIDCNDTEASVISLLRKGRSTEDLIVIVANYTPVVRENYQIGVPRAGAWTEVLNSDAEVYGGSGLGNLGGVEAAPIACHGRPCMISLTLPPLGIIFLKSDGTTSPETS